MDEAFSYLRSQSEGRGGNTSNDVNVKQKSDVNGTRSESTSQRIQNESNNSFRNERAGSIEIQDAVLDSSKDYDSLEQTGVKHTDLENSNKR